MRRFLFSLVMAGALCTPVLTASAFAAAASATVKKGDTLYGIAKANGLSVAQLRALNSLSGNNIRVGQVLKVSGAATRPAPVRRAAAPAASHFVRAVSAKTYTVKSGDTLGHIASRVGLSVTQLQRLNGLKTSVVRVGQTLKLTAGASVAATVRAVPTRATSTAARATSQGLYTVRGGDTLGEISSRYGVSVLALQTTNNLSGTVINVGQKLRIPARGASRGQSVARLPAGMEARTIYTYVRVALRDTPASFAARYNTTPETIRRLNGLSTVRQITVGAKLLVPSRMAVPVPPRPQRAAATLRQLIVRGVSVQVVQVDLRWRNVRVTPVLASEGLKFRSGATVNGLSQISGAQAVINGSYFHPQTYAPAGDIVKDGRLLTWGRIPSALSITPDNRASIQGSTTAVLGRPLDSTWNGMETVIASGPRLMQGGYVLNTYSRVFQDPAVFGLAARSAIGLKSSRDLLLVSTHARLSVRQMGQIMAALGARDALLLDGGSSAGLSYNGASVLRSVRRVSYGIGIFTGYTGRRYAR